MASTSAFVKSKPTDQFFPQIC